MNKVASIVITIFLVVGIGALFFQGSTDSNSKTTVQSGSNVEVIDGIQYVRVTAKGGYSPRVSTAKAGIPTKLIIKTNGTYDCSSSLVIRSIGYQKILSQTGEENIDLGVLATDQSIQGVCGMGMYNFKIQFN